jgi:hypothetical protein
MEIREALWPMREFILILILNIRIVTNSPRLVKPRSAGQLTTIKYAPFALVLAYIRGVMSPLRTAALPLLLAIATSTSAAPAPTPAAPSMSLDELLARADRQNLELTAQRAEIAVLRQRAAADPRSAGLADVQDARLEQRRAEVAAKVRSGFARTLAAREMLALSERSYAAAEQVLSEASARKDAAAEKEHARVFLVRVAQVRAAAERELADVAAELLWVTGAASEERLKIKGSLASTSKLGDQPIDALVQRALSTRGDLKAVRREYDLALSTKSPGTTGEQQELQATRASRAAENLMAAIRVDVTASVSRVLAARRALSASALDDGFVPGDKQRGAFLDAYRAGKWSVGALTLALRDTADAERQRVGAIAELVTADAELARAVGSRTD